MLIKGKEKNMEVVVEKRLEITATNIEDAIKELEKMKSEDFIVINVYIDKRLAHVNDKQ